MKMSMVAPELRSTLRRFPTVPVDRAWVRRLARFGVRRLPTVDTPGVTVEAAGVVPGTRRAGVATTFHAVPGAPHGFESWAADAAISRGHVAAAQSWLRSLLATHQDA